MKEQMDWLIETAMAYDFSVDIKDSTHKKSIVERAADEIAKFARYGLTFTLSPCKTV